MFRMENTFNKPPWYLVLLVIPLTKISGQFVIEGSYDIVKGQSPDGSTPIQLILVRSRIECVAYCQRTSGCIVIKTEKQGSRHLCMLFDQSITLNAQVYNGSQQMVAVKGKYSVTCVKRTPRFT